MSTIPYDYGTTVVYQDDGVYVQGSRVGTADEYAEQAATIEETSASMEEMSSMTQQNAQNSRDAAALMQRVDQTVADSTVSYVEVPPQLLPSMKVVHGHHRTNISFL